MPENNDGDESLPQTPPRRNSITTLGSLFRRASWSSQSSLPARKGRLWRNSPTTKSTTGTSSRTEKNCGDCEAAFSTDSGGPSFPRHVPWTTKSCFANPSNDVLHRKNSSSDEPSQSSSRFSNSTHDRSKGGASSEDSGSFCSHISIDMDPSVCAVCHDQMRDHKAVPGCYHVFHKECLKKLKYYRTDSDPCPICSPQPAGPKRDFEVATRRFLILKRGIDQGEHSWNALRERDDVREVFWTWREAAAAGHYGAQVELGDVYRKGQGVESSSVEAFRWYYMAAKQGVASAQYNVGVLYSSGSGIEQNQLLAARWYEKAGRQGLSSAQYNLGNMYRNGRGVDVDTEKAICWYRLAARQHHEYAAYNLDIMLKNKNKSEVANVEAPFQSKPINRVLPGKPLYSTKPLHSRKKELPPRISNARKFPTTNTSSGLDLFPPTNTDNGFDISGVLDMFSWGNEKNELP